MKGDFSRLGPWPDEQTTGVWLQQGRPLLDADWNALQFSLRHMVTGAVDAILGGPATAQADAGFEVSVRGSLPLNQDPQGAHQAVYLMPSHSLPFRGRGTLEGAADDTLAGADNEEEAPDAALLDRLDLEHHEHHDRPYVLELELRAKSGAAGIVVERPGAVVVRLGADGQLTLGLDSEDPVTASGGPVGAARLRLALVHSGRFYRLFRDGLQVAEWRGRTHPQPLVHARALALGGPPNGAETGFLACNLDHLRIWTARDEHHHHHHHHRRFHLACDLDFGELQHGRVHDRSRHGNDGRLSSTGAMPEPSVQSWLGAGRYFVDGARIINPKPTPLDHTLPDTDQNKAHLVYLEVWERTVSALEQPDLREVALGGPDTVVHSRTAWRTRAVHGADAEAALAAFRAIDARPRGQAAFRHAGAPDENALYRVEIHHPGWAYAWPPGPRARQAVLPARRGDDGRLSLPANGLTPEVGAPLLAFAETGGPWVVRVAAGSDAKELVVTGGPTAWPDGAIGLLPLASFKWSADNAAEAFLVESIVPVQDPDMGALGRVQLATAGFNGLDLQVGDWVELRPDADPSADETGGLYPIGAFDRGLLQVDLADWDGGPAVQTGLSLRRWGPAVQNSPDPAGGYPPVASEAATRLDDHVLVGFDGEGYYAAGDWWTLALRQDADAPWSTTECRTAMTPGGGGLRRVPLALIERGRDGPHVADLRRLFADLPTLSGGASPTPPGPIPPWPVPPGPTPHPPSSEEVAHWLRHHAPGVRLLSEGAAPPGFRVTGEHLTVRCLEAARWESVHTEREGPRGAGQAVFANGRVIFLEDGAAGVWSWSPETGWTPLPPRPLARRGFAAVAAGSTVVVVGGAGGFEDSLCEPIEILLPDGAWRRLDHARVKAFQPAAAVIGSTLYVTGGRDRSGTVLHRCEAIDLYTGEVFELPPMHKARAEHAMVAYDGGLWVFGGVDNEGQPSKTAEAHPLLTGRWRPLAPMALPLRGLSAAAIDDGIVVAGGAAGGDSLQTECRLYRPARDSWTDLAPLPGPARSVGLAADIDPDGESSLFRVGGHGPNGALGDFAALKIRRMLNLLSPVEEH